MVQPNTEARPRRSRTRRGEEQAPLVESQPSLVNDAIMDGEGTTSLFYVASFLYNLETTHTMSTACI